MTHLRLVTPEASPELLPVITPRVGHTLLERMQESAGMPYHAPTVQVKRARHGEYQPHNPLAQSFAKIARSGGMLPEWVLDVVRGMGINVEVVS